MVNYSSDHSHHFVQTSTEGLQTVEAKHKFERFSANCGVKIKYYHADNKVFNERIFHQSCVAANQTQTFCGVSTQHQNGTAERKTQTTVF